MPMRPSCYMNVFTTLPLATTTFLMWRNLLEFTQEFFYLLLLCGVCDNFLIHELYINIYCIYMLCILLCMLILIKSTNIALSTQ